MDKNTYFVSFSNRCFSSSKRLLRYIKRRKSFFHDLVSPSMTWEYKGLQGVTGGYKRLQGVTGGDKGLQEFQRIIQSFF